MTLSKMTQPGTGRHQEDRKELAQNLKGKTVGRRKRLETFCPSKPYKAETMMLGGRKRRLYYKAQLT